MIFDTLTITTAKKIRILSLKYYFDKLINDRKQEFDNKIHNDDCLRRNNVQMEIYQ